MLRKVFRLFLFFVGALVIVLSGVYFYLAAQSGKTAARFKVFANEENAGRPLVIAHRGGSGIAPENTLEAFGRSHDLGVDVLELDVHLTKDGKLVVIHDSSVDRTTDGKGLVKEKTSEEIQTLDAGYNWTKDGGKTFPFRGQGVKIPLLREVFEKFPDIRINIEAKDSEPSPVRPLCDLIREFKREDKVIVASFHKEVLRDFRRNCREVATSASPSESTWFLTLYELGLSENFRADMQAMQIPRRIGRLEVVTRDFLKATRRRNLQLHVWTINKKEEMKRLTEIGVDGIMTDYPDRLIDLLGKRK